MFQQYSNKALYKNITKRPLKKFIFDFRYHSIIYTGSDVGGSCIWPRLYINKFNLIATQALKI